MTSSPPPDSQTPDLTPLAPGHWAGEFRIAALIVQEGILGHTVQRYEVEPIGQPSAPQVPGQGPLQLRRILPPPPTARTEAEWLAAVQERGQAEEMGMFSDALAAWSDAQASYLVERPRGGQSLQQYLAAHLPLPAQDGELLARGLLGAAAGLHGAGLHLPALTPAQVWLDRSGGVGLHDLWAALGGGSVGGDLHRIGELLRGAVQQPAAGSPLARLLDALGAPAGHGLPISAQAAPATTALPAEQPATAAPQLAGPDAEPAPLHSGRAAPPPRPLWPWLLPVAGLLLGGILYLGWPQLSGALQSRFSATTSPQAATQQTVTQQAGTDQTATAPEPGDTAQVMTLPAILNLRPGADTAGAPLATIPGRTLLPVLSQKGEWYKVRYGELAGWVSSEYVLPVLSRAEVDALTQAAAKGGRVTLARGVYLLGGPLEVRWDTELSGQGREQTYLLGNQGNYVLGSRDVRLTLRDLTVAWTGQGPGQPVLVERGTFAGQNIWLTGGVPDGAQRAQGSGLWLRSGAQAQVSGSLFSRNAIGISVDDSRLDLSDSQLSNNRFAGAVFSGQASGEIRDNQLEGNAEDGVIVAGRAAPTLTGNRVQGSGQRGIDIGANAAPTLQGNRITGGQYGITVGGQATPQLRGNAISGAAEGGLQYSAQAAGTAEGNTISAAATGIRLEEAAAPTLRGNQLLQLRGEALSYSGTAGGQANENVIQDAGGNGVTLAGQASPTLEGNRVSRGQQSGIVVQDQSQAQLRRNTVQAQVQHGIVVTGEAAPVLEQNALLNNGGYGLVFKEAAGGSGERNLCQNNRAGPAILKLSPAVFGPLFGRDGCMDGVSWPAPPAPTPPADSVPSEPVPANPQPQPPAETQPQDQSKGTESKGTAEGPAKATSSPVPPAAAPETAPTPVASDLPSSSASAETP
ncbi:MAG: right-handed parallel beta-helix repeat-containing protein [Deinococcus sp.]|nr:right-handed parallel beta-helix repeat-containing protein [Deinococcus sp.]